MKDKIKKLLSLPPNLTGCFHKLTGLPEDEWFCSNDPADHKLGSGGGSAWLLKKCYESEKSGEDFSHWLASCRRLLIHAGGQSRRLPAYAPLGKVLTPIPVLRWERGQRLSQNLLELQVPFYEHIMDIAPRGLNTLIASGDVLIRAAEQVKNVPMADVVCFGLWLPAEIATDHGVFVSSRKEPSRLKSMLQTPSLVTLSALLTDNYYLTDIGLWMLSDRAVDVLMRRSSDGKDIINYDLYGTFGCALGTEPTMTDELVNSLSVAVVPLAGGEFYHFGTSHELISSTLAIQNIVTDQRLIMHHSRKPHPAIFVQNAVTKIKITAENRNVWIENSCIGPNWRISHENIITGVPENDWNINLEAEQCLDFVPVGESGMVVRPYKYYDKFAGDEQSRKQFPVAHNAAEAGVLARFMLSQDNSAEAKRLFDASEKMSAEQITASSNLIREERSRRHWRALNWSLLAENHEHSVFYQIDLNDAAVEFNKYKVAEPAPLNDGEPLMKRISDSMFRAKLHSLRGEPSEADEQKAFSLLGNSIKDEAMRRQQQPRLAVLADQIVWARSPVRIDLAGGWTDTPPFCLMEGGNVVNIAVELNGQPPLQTFVKPCAQPHIVLRSIDMGDSETIETREQLADFKHVGSAFSIPKAALALAGFLPQFCAVRHQSLANQLKAFGSGIELTTLSAVPAGSGLGTSSILAATVLGALNDFCALAWDKTEIGQRTLILEQLLTTGGGWQDQFGGLFPGVKLLQTDGGIIQSPLARMLPQALFTNAEYRACHLLYYTGITRTAKKILAEIVMKMFLNERDVTATLRCMKEHAMEMYEAIEYQNFERMGRLVGKTWLQNQALDAGTNPPEIAEMTRMIDDLCFGYKLPGAGGGGFLYMIAKDPEAASRIKKTLSAGKTARFVDMQLSDTGLQVSRS
jgi:galactokinase/mevalonate kinase-like predicted kinase